MAAIISDGQGRVVIGVRKSTSHGTGMYQYLPPNNRVCAHQKSGQWQFPGGHLEMGESFFACAERETLEETGLVVKAEKMIAATNDIFDPKSKHYITVFVKCRRVDETQEPVVSVPEAQEEGSNAEAERSRNPTSASPGRGRPGLTSRRCSPGREETKRFFCLLSTLSGIILTLSRWSSRVLLAAGTPCRRERYSFAAVATDFNTLADQNRANIFQYSSVMSTELLNAELGPWEQPRRTFSFIMGRDPTRRTGLPHSMQRQLESQKDGRGRKVYKGFPSYAQRVSIASVLGPKLVSVFSMSRIPDGRIKFANKLSRVSGLWVISVKTQYDRIAEYVIRWKRSVVKILMPQEGMAVCLPWILLITVGSWVDSSKDTETAGPENSVKRVQITRTIRCVPCPLGHCATIGQLLNFFNDNFSILLV